MKKIILTLVMMFATLSVATQTEARPLGAAARAVGKTVRFFRTNKPVRSFFRNRQPVRRAAKAVGRGLRFVLPPYGDR